MTQAQVVGWTLGKPGKAAGETLVELMAGVVPAALPHVGLGGGDVDGIFVGVYDNGFSPQAFESALAGMAMPEPASVPATRRESAERMTTTPTERARDIMLTTSCRNEEGEVAGGFAGGPFGF